MDKVAEVIRFADQYGVHLDPNEAHAYIAAQRALARNPDDPEAQRVAHHFAALLALCKPDSELRFEDFTEGPECPPRCPECAERSRRYLERELPKTEELLAALPSIDRCRALKIFRLTGPGRTEGWYGFLARTGLTRRQVERMSDEELRSHA